MGRRIDEKELRRRALASVRAEVEAFGRGATSSSSIVREDLLAAVVPAAPRRSVFNSVCFERAETLRREVEMLTEAYAAGGIDAWTVWVPDEDRGSAGLLVDRGHALDGAPRAMAVELAALAPEPTAPQGIEPGPLEPTVAAELNDRAYGHGDDGFRAGLSRETGIRWFGAYEGDEPVCCVGTIPLGDDVCVSGVAAPPEHRGRGIAGWLMARALAAARREGALSASLRASAAGAPVYERLGFRDLGFVEMWELRR